MSEPSALTAADRAFGLACPHCGLRAMSAPRKWVTGWGSVRACKSCGQRVEVDGLRVMAVTAPFTLGCLALAVWALGLPWGAGILLGAILAPTDPVLATDVQVRHPGDRDQLRFTLTCEAGMNDGSAFPFVMLGLGLLGLHDLGDWGMKWLMVDVLWATAAAIAIGGIAVVALARLGWILRRAPHQH